MRFRRRTCATFETDASRSPAGWLARLAKADQRELAALAWSFAYFFLLLAAYYVLRPVRTELSVQTGVKNLPWLLSATFMVTLAIQPVFGWLTGKYPRARTLPVIYAFFALNLLGFYAAFGADAQEPWLAKTFFIWLSVFNLFVVSMADVFTADQGKRLFAVVSAGGSLGALAGASIPALAATVLGIDKLMLISTMLLAACIACIRGLRRWAGRAANTSGNPSDDEEPLGGGLLAGIRQSLTSPYLGGISLYVLLWTYSSIALDLEVARVLGESIAAPLERTQLAGRIEQAVGAISLAVPGAPRHRWRPVCGGAGRIQALTHRHPNKGELKARRPLSLVGLPPVARDFHRRSCCICRSVRRRGLTPDFGPEPRARPLIETCDRARTGAA